MARPEGILQTRTVWAACLRFDLDFMLVNTSFAGRGIVSSPFYHCSFKVLQHYSGYKNNII